MASWFHAAMRCLVLVALAFASGSAGAAERGTGTIATVAGRDPFSGDGGPARRARLNSPHGIARVAAGNLYVADTGHERIRKIAAATGVITTVAGNGTAAFAGDGGPATAASLNTPADVASDARGTVYIVEYVNNRVRKVDAATGVITTIAGNGQGAFSRDDGPATAASRYYPQGVAVDRAGQVYIADADNNRIRCVAGATRVITTVAGNGIDALAGDGGPAVLANLSYPQSVAVERSGHLLIADTNNERIRRVLQP